MWLVALALGGLIGVRMLCPGLGLGPASVSVCSPNKLSTRFPISSRSSVQFFCEFLLFVTHLDKPVALSSKVSSMGESEDGTEVIGDFVAREVCRRVLEISRACTLRANKESR